jgi:hypothetical protein
MTQIIASIAAYKTRRRVALGLGVVGRVVVVGLASAAGESEEKED